MYARRYSLVMTRVSPRRPVTPAPLLSGVLLLWCACAPAPPRETHFDLGWGPDPQLAPTTAETPAPELIADDQRKPWRHAARFDTFTAVPARGPSEHLGGSYLRRVWVAEPTPRYARGLLTTPLPPTTIIVQQHSLPDTPAVAANYFVMERRAVPNSAARWHFSVLDGQLRVATKKAPAACARCHSDAPHHGVFGPPPATPAAPP